MNPKTMKDKELESILNRFARFIYVHIHKYNLDRYGLDSEDVSQEVKIKIWKLLNDEKKIHNYASYIKKIVDSLVIDQLRKLRREERIFHHEKLKKVSEQESNYKPDSSPGKRFKECIGEAVDSLLESRRNAVKLHLLNMTIEEIALINNWSNDKTRNLLYRGLSNLKAKLKEMGIEYEG